MLATLKKIFGHRHHWIYDYPSMPTYRRCYRCKTREHLRPDSIAPFVPNVWEKVEWAEKGNGGIGDGDLDMF